MIERVGNFRAFQVGFSLPEALLCAAIIAIMLGVALPLFSPLQEAEGERLLTEFDAVLRTARSAAIRRGQSVRICPAGPSEPAGPNGPAGPGDGCGTDWREGVIVIAEDAHASPRLIAHRPWRDVQGNLSWRAFGNRQFLVIDAYGLLDHQNGTLLWCPPHGLQNTASQLIVNSAGRTRLLVGQDDTRCR